MTGVKLAALGLLIGIMALMLKHMGFSGDRVFSLLGAVGILLISLEGVEALFTEAMRLSAEREEDVRAIMKIIATGYVFGICADGCAELGENGIAKAITLAGRIEVLLLALPYLTRLFSLASELL